MRVRFIIILAISLVAILKGGTHYVSKTGSSVTPYTTWATAADSIQKAIDVSSFGDTVYVGTGVYIEEIQMIRGLTLLGNGIDSTIIDYSSFPTFGVAVRMPDHTILKNVGIKCSLWEDATHQHAIMTDDTVLTYYEVLISNNKIYDGRNAITAYNLKGNISNNIIIGAYNGIQLNTSSWNLNQLVTNNFVSTYSTCITCIYGARPNIINNTLITERGYGYYKWLVDSLKLFNNLIISTDNSNDSWALVSAEQPAVIKNNIIIGAFEYGIVAANGNIVKNNIVLNCKNGIRVWEGHQPVMEYNNSWNNVTNYINLPDDDTTNLSVNPMFFGTDSNDVRLQMYSPMIDAGSPEIHDVDGSRSDLGIYGGPYGSYYRYIDYPPLKPESVDHEIGAI